MSTEKGKGGAAADVPRAEDDADDSSNDSDYAPEPDKEDEEEVDAGALGGDRIGGGIRVSKRDKIDTLWKEINAEGGKVVRPGATAKNEKGKNGGNRRSKKVQKILASMFGKRSAGDILARAEAAVAGGDAEASFKRRKSATVDITEKIKFAGQEITVKRKAAASERAAAEESDKKRAGAGSSGLDKMLESLNGPRSINAVEKSSMDWDRYKDEKGIAEDLKEVTKDGAGYLHKQEFLNRVDVRTFERERDMRAAARRTK